MGTVCYVRGMRPEGQQIWDENMAPDEGSSLRTLGSHGQWLLSLDTCSEPSWLAGIGWGLPVEGLPSSGQMGNQGQGGVATPRGRLPSPTARSALGCSKDFCPISMETSSHTVCVTTICPAAGPALRTDPANTLLRGSWQERCSAVPWIGAGTAAGHLGPRWPPGFLLAGAAGPPA